jgi:hypothetical protein
MLWGAARASSKAAGIHDFRRLAITAFLLVTGRGEMAEGMRGPKSPMFEVLKSGDFS